MAVHIRLRRIGKNPKKNPFFRVSVFDHRRSRDGKIIEEIGFYNPVTGKASLKKDRLEYWVTKGAQPSATVKSLLKKMGKGAENAAASA